jgi:uncharacterized protein
MRKISIVVKTNSKKPGIEVIDDTNWVVRVREQPIDGKANLAVINAISGFLRIPKSKISIVKGETSKKKLVEISD